MMLRILLAASFIGGTVGFASAGPEPEHVDCTSLAYHIDRDINDTTWVSENQAAGHLETYMALCPETASGTKLAIDGGGLFTILSYLLPSDVSGTHLWDEKYSYHGHEHDEHVGGENQVIFGGNYHDKAVVGQDGVTAAPSTHVFAVLGATGMYAKYNGGYVTVKYMEDLTRKVMVCCGHDDEEDGHRRLVVEP